MVMIMTTMMTTVACGCVSQIWNIPETVDEKKKKTKKEKIESFDGKPLDFLF